MIKRMVMALVFFLTLVVVPRTDLPAGSRSCPKGYRCL
jgi:hypothetical protein